MRLYLASFAAALATTLVLTPLVRRAARQWNIVDKPDARRKLHKDPTPLGGGVAVFLGFLAALTFVFVFSTSQHDVLVENAPFVMGLIAASLFIVLIGIFDDRYGLRGRQKLAAQIAAGLMLAVSGLWIGEIQLFGQIISLGPLALPITLFWVVGAINALNLIDGVDGLATSVGIVLSLSLAAMAGMAGHATEAFIALALAGALLAFLAYNRPPATIFLGDAGSMLIGLILGALAVRTSLKGPTTVAMIAPAAVWAIPMFDSAMAILRRRLTGRSIYETDRNHLHHRLMGRGLDTRQTVFLIALFCGTTATAAVIATYVENEFLAVGAVLAVLFTLVLFRVFGHQELHLLGQRLRNLTRSLIPSRRGIRQEAVPTYARMQGTREWDDLWKTLITFAERFDVSAVQMNLTMPMIAEEYHADWNRKQRPNESVLWHSDIPLVVHEVAVGRLRITGASRPGNACEWMGDLIVGLKPFESQLLEMISEHVGTRLQLSNQDTIEIPLSDLSATADLEATTTSSWRIKGTP